MYVVVVVVVVVEPTGSPPFVVPELFVFGGNGVGVVVNPYGVGVAEIVGKEDLLDCGSLFPLKKIPLTTKKRTTKTTITTTIPKISRIGDPSSSMTGSITLLRLNGKIRLPR